MSCLVLFQTSQQKKPLKSRSKSHKQKGSSKNPLENILNLFGFNKFSQMRLFVLKTSFKILGLSCPFFVCFFSLVGKKNRVKTHQNLCSKSRPVLMFSKWLIVKTLLFFEPMKCPFSFLKSRSQMSQICPSLSYHAFSILTE